MKMVTGTALLCVVVGCSNAEDADPQTTTRHENGNIASRGNMLDGQVKAGEWVYFYENGQKEKQGHYIENLQQGTWTFWLLDGSESWTAQYEKGTGNKNGRISTFYKSGKKKSESTYRDNRLHGVSNVWYTDGQKIQEQHYRNGRQEGTRTQWFFPSGKKRLEDRWKEGQREGLESKWYRNGQQTSEGNWIAGKEDGVWAYWDKDGNATRSLTFKDGKLVK